jgi:hypothetical protein
MTRLLFPVFSRITKNGLSPAYSQDAKHSPESKIYDMGKKEYKGLIFKKMILKIFLLGEVSPSLHPGLRPVLRYPLLGAAGYHPLQDSHICWAHPRRASDNLTPPFGHPSPTRRGEGNFYFIFSFTPLLVGEGPGVRSKRRERPFLLIYFL